MYIFQKYVSLSRKKSVFFFSLKKTKQKKKRKLKSKNLKKKEEKKKQQQEVSKLTRHFRFPSKLVSYIVASRYERIGARSPNGGGGGVISFCLFGGYSKKDVSLINNRFNLKRISLPEIYTRCGRNNSHIMQNI